MILPSLRVACRTIVRYFIDSLLPRTIQLARSATLLLTLYARLRLRSPSPATTAAQRRSGIAHGKQRQTGDIKRPDGFLTAAARRDRAFSNAMLSSLGIRNARRRKRQNGSALKPAAAQALGWRYSYVSYITGSPSLHGT